jgi:hypothetical protein
MRDTESFDHRCTDLMSIFSKSSFCHSEMRYAPSHGDVVLGGLVEQIVDACTHFPHPDNPVIIRGLQPTHTLLLSPAPRCFLLSIATYLLTPQETRAK